MHKRDKTSDFCQLLKVHFETPLVCSVLLRIAFLNARMHFV